MALRMYAYGAVNSLQEAAEAMDLNNAYLGLVANSKPGTQFMESCDSILQDRALEGAQLLDRLGKRAVEIIARHAEHSKNDKVSLEAAKDLADRSQTYSKVQKHQVEAITLTGKDAKDLAEALIRGRSVHEQFSELAHGNYNRIEDGSSPSNSDASRSERRDDKQPAQ